MGGRTRAPYPSEYKAELVRLVREGPVTIGAVRENRGQTHNRGGSLVVEF